MNCIAFVPLKKKNLCLFNLLSMCLASFFKVWLFVKKAWCLYNTHNFLKIPWTAIYLEGRFAKTGDHFKKGLKYWIASSWGNCNKRSYSKGRCITQDFETWR